MEDPRESRTPRTPGPGDRIRRKGTELEPGASGLFERWADEGALVATVHWDDQPFHVYDTVRADLLELEPPTDPEQ